jgi:hypothetical protein
VSVKSTHNCLCIVTWAWTCLCVCYIRDMWYSGNIRVVP